MNIRRSLLLSGIVLLWIFSDSSFAQRRRFENRLGSRCYVEAPITALEAFESRMQTIVVRGSTHVGTVTACNGSARVDSVEFRDESVNGKASGAVITLREAAQEANQPVDETRSYIDYEEIDRVVKAWDQVARTDDTITKLNNFESRYRTRDDFEIAVFRQTPGGTVAASVSGGVCERNIIFMSLDELIKLRHMVAQAKEKLDEMK
ncbi:MAG TPA: hypothetical protein VN643_27115 [Pyrinomonadaceae bacterium]|nr:hypothetical protein [Pyrinomonadaceae bacterium]